MDALRLTGLIMNLIIAFCACLYIFILVHEYNSNLKYVEGYSTVFPELLYGLGLIISTVPQFLMYLRDLIRHGKHQIKKIQNSSILDFSLLEASINDVKLPYQLKTFHPLRFWALFFGLCHLGVGIYFFTRAFRKYMLQSSSDDLIILIFTGIFVVSGAVAIIYAVKLKFGN